MMRERNIAYNRYDTNNYPLIDLNLNLKFLNYLTFLNHESFGKSKLVLIRDRNS